MSFIQNLFTSRDNNANAETYVGQQDRIWWDPTTNAFYYSDGNTAGGLPVGLSNSANVTVNSITANFGNIIGDLTIGGNISPASDVKIGGVRAGPGANISNTGLLTIDTAGLPFSFGNFTANNNILTLVNVNEDMILETSGNAEIQLIGNVGFYKPNGGGVPDPDALFFFARDDGQLTIIVPAEDPFLGAVEIIGSATGNLIPPGAPGAMLHITGNPGIPARVYLDGNGEYASFVARRFNGNVAVPTQVLAGQDVLRINTTAATDAGVGNVAMAQIRTTALENQTTTAQGSSITFTVTPIGSPANARVDVANITVANGVTATKFTTAGTVSATGNITGGNISATNHTGTTVNVTGNITGGNLLTGGLISATGNITGGNVSATGLTGTLLTASQPNITSVGTLGSLTVTANVTGGNILTGGSISATGNITGGNVTATNYTGLVTHSIRNAGAVGGTTLTLNVTTDDIVHCTFTTDFTVAFSNIVAGRVVTLIATNTSGADTDVINSGIAALNTTSAGTFTVSPQTTAVVTYYSLDGAVGNIYASAVYA
jgi:hypothetical protein